MIGYILNNRIGAHVYNIGHTYTIPALLVIGGVAFNKKLLVAMGLIWIAHIALDRALGYGLKLSTGFKDTHLGRI
jgi:hypothetical protein